MGDNILVAVRVRPLIERERVENAPISWRVRGTTEICQIDTVEQKSAGGTGSSYKFDYVFGTEASNSDVYERCVNPLVDSALKGINATIFAYGQTASGKTHTMMGSRSEKGVLPLVVNEIFDVIENNPDREYLLRASFMEIYQEQITDLLTGNARLKVVDANNEVTIKDLHEEMCVNQSSVLDLMKKGEKLRHTACTNMNERSSRSHTIFRIIIESRSRCAAEAGDLAIQVSQLNLVDLAGSEKANQTGATGERFKEGCSINVSLSSLGFVIDQLSRGERHINFRDNKLTHILRMSLGGNARTAIICAISPASLDESHSTLRFAMRAKTIKNQPTVNEVLSDKAMLKRYERKIKELQEQLQNSSSLNQSIAQPELSSIIEEKDRMIRELKEKLVVSTHAAPPKASVSEIDRSSRRKTWCPSLSKKTAPIPPPLQSFKDSVTLPNFSKSSPNLFEEEEDEAAYMSTNMKKKKFFNPLRTSMGVACTSPEDEDFDDHHFRMECLVEEEEDNTSVSAVPFEKRSVHFAPDTDLKEKLSKSDVGVQTNIVNGNGLESPKTPIGQLPLSSIGTPATELRRRIRSLADHLKNVEDCYNSLSKEHIELREYTKLESEVGFKEDWQDERRIKMTNELELARDEIMSLEKNNNDLEEAVNDLTHQLSRDRERYTETISCMQAEIIQPLQQENREVKKLTDALKSQVDQLEKDKVDLSCQFELYQQKMDKQVVDLKASLQQAWQDAENAAQGLPHAASTESKELELQVATLQNEMDILQQKMTIQEANYGREITELTRKLEAQAAELDGEIATKQQLESDIFALRQEVESARGYLDSTVMTTQKGKKRVSSSPIREDVSVVALGVKPVQKKLKMEETEDQTATTGGDDFNELELIKCQLVALREALSNSEEEASKKDKTIKELMARIDSSKLKTSAIREDVRRVSDTFETHKSSTEGYIAELEKENEDLREELNQHTEPQSDHTQVRKFVDLQDYFVSQWYSAESSTTEKLSCVEKIASELAKKNSELEEVVKSLNEGKIALATKLEEVEATIESVSLDRDAVKAEVEKQASTVQEQSLVEAQLRERVALLEEERSIVIAQIEESSEKSTEVQALAERLQQQLTQATELTLSLRTELEIKLQLVVQLEEALSASEKEKEKLCSEVESLSKVVAAKETAIATLNASESDLKQALDMVNEALTDAEAQMPAKDSLIDNLKKQLAATTEQVKTQEEALNKLRTELTSANDKLAQAVSASTNTSDSITTELSTVRSELAEKETLLRAAIEEKEAVSVSLKTAESDAELKTEIINKLQAVIEVLEAEYTMFKDAQEKNKFDENDLVCLQKKLEVSELRVGELQRKLQETDTLLTEEKTRGLESLVEGEAEVLHLKQELDKLKSDVASAEQERLIARDTNQTDMSMEITMAGTTAAGRKPVGLFIGRSVEDTSLIGLGVETRDDDHTEGFPIYESTAVGQTATGMGASNEIELMRCQLLLLQDTIRKEQDGFSAKMKEAEEKYEELMKNKNEVIKELMEKLAVVESKLSTAEHKIREAETQMPLSTNHGEVLAELRLSVEQLTAEKGQVADQLVAMEVDRDQLADKLAKYKADADQLSALKDNLEAEKDTLEKELFGRDETISSLEAEVASLTTQVSLLQESLADHSKCGESLQKSHNEVSLLQSSIESLNARLMNYQQSIDDFKGTAEAAAGKEAKLMENKETVAKLEAEVLRLNANVVELEELKSRVKIQEEEIQRLREDYETASCLVSDYEGELEDAKQRLATELASKDSQIATLETQLTNIENETEQLRHNVVLKSKMVEELKTEMATLQKSLEETVEQLKAFEASSQSQNEMAVSSYTSTVEQLKQELHDAKMAYELQTASNAETAESLAEVQKKVEDLKGKNTILEQKVNDLTDVANARENEAHSADQLAMKLQSQLEEQKIKHDELLKSSEEASKLKEEKDSAVALVALQTATIAQAADDLAKAQKKVKDLEGETATFHQKINDLTDAVSAKENEAHSTGHLVMKLQSELDEQKIKHAEILKSSEEANKLMEEKESAVALVASLEAELVDKLKALADENHRVSDLEAQIVTMAAAFDVERSSFGTEAADLKKNVEQQQTELGYLEAAKSSVELLLAKTESELAESTEARDRLASILKDKESELENVTGALREGLAQKETQLVELLADKEKTALNLETATAQLAEVKLQHESKIGELIVSHAVLLGEKEAELTRINSERSAILEQLVEATEELQKIKSSQDLFVSQDESATLAAKEEELRAALEASATLMERVEALTVEVTASSEALAQASVTNQARAEKIYALEKQLLEFDQIQNLLTDSALKIQELEEKLVESRSVNSELHAANQELSNLELKHNAVLGELSLMKSKLETEKETSASFLELQEKYKALEADRAELASQLMEYEQCKVALTQAESERKALEGQLAALRQSQAAFEANCNQLSQECDAYQKQKQSLENRVEELEYSRREQSNSVAALQAQYATYIAEREKLIAEKKALTESCEELNLRLSEAEQRRAVTPVEDVSKLKEENSRLTDSCRYLSEKLDSVELVCQDAGNSLKLVKAEKDALLKNVEGLEKVVGDLQNEIRSAKNDIDEELAQGYKEAKIELEQSYSKIQDLQNQVNSLESFIKEKGKSVPFTSWEEYKGVKSNLGSVGPYEVNLLERCMRKMEKEVEALKQQIVVLEGKVNKNAEVARHYKGKLIEYRNKYYTEIGELDKVIVTEEGARPAAPQLNRIQEESREESQNESAVSERAQPSVRPAVEPVKEVAVPAAEPVRAEAPVAAAEEKSSSGRSRLDERVPLANLNSPRKMPPPSPKAEKAPIPVPGTPGAVANFVNQIESKQVPSTRNMAPPTAPTTERMTRSRSQRRNDAEVPPNCKQQ